MIVNMVSLLEGGRSALILVVGQAVAIDPANSLGKVCAADPDLMHAPAGDS